MNTSNKQKPIAWAVIDSSGNVVELAKTRLSLEHDHIRSDDKIVALYLSTNEELSQNAQKCFDGWKQLADMDDMALESEEAEKIRDELDVYWDKLTEEDRAQLDQKIIDYNRSTSARKMINKFGYGHDLAKNPEDFFQKVISWKNDIKPSDIAVKTAKKLVEMMQEKPRSLCIFEDLIIIDYDHSTIEVKDNIGEFSFTEFSFTHLEKNRE